MIRSEAVLGLPGYQITGIEEQSGKVRISARYTGPISCPHCGGVRLRVKDRRVRHRGTRAGEPAFGAGIGKPQVAVPGLRPQFLAALSGHSAAQTGHRPFRRSIYGSTGTGSTAAGWAGGKASAAPPWSAGSRFPRHAQAERSGAVPAGAGHRRALLHPAERLRHHVLRPASHKIYDVVLGRSEAALEAYLSDWRARTRCG